MDYRENGTGAKRLSALIMIFFLTLLAAHVLHAQENRLGDIPLHPEIYKKYQKAWPMEMAEMLPSSYDARNESLVTLAKNQGSCGSCWAFASVGAMESHMLKAYGAGPEDLSEQQQVSCNTSMWGCDGGSSNAIKYWEQKGSLDEDCFLYTTSDLTPCGESNCMQLGYRVIDWHTVTVSTNDFKNSLYTYGPSYWRYDVYSDFDTFWRDGNPGQVYTSQSGSSYRGGHAVLLIGWDDSKGAYLCKNSWGIGGPNNDGTFWIAYSGHYYNLGFGMVNFSLTSLTCSSDSDCDDGIYCNGAETCINDACSDGIPPDCSDDGLFCNGSEVCDEANQSCGHTENPCEAGTVCIEENDSCILESCGNSHCETGENCNNCPSDCKSGSIWGTDCDDCFKDKCDGICHPTKDGSNCPDCSISYCCGDGVCEGGENSINCAIDCGSGPECGDGNCDLGEDCSNCPADCAVPENCSDGLDNDCDELIDCSDLEDCSGVPACSEDCKPKGQECTFNSECCSGRCHAKKGTCL